MRITEPRQNWSLTSAAFHNLLSWLDEGQNSDGESYLRIKSRLVLYFDRKNRPAPDELADETLERVARRLEEEGVIETETPAKYCYIVARFVFLESLRADKRTTSLDEIAQREQFASGNDNDEKEAKESALVCLEKCAGELKMDERDVIYGYYVGAGRSKIDNRREIAKKLGVSPNALAIRACRIRTRLQICVAKCTKRESGSEIVL